MRQKKQQQKNVKQKQMQPKKKCKKTQKKQKQCKKKRTKNWQQNTPNHIVCACNKDKSSLFWDLGVWSLENIFFGSFPMFLEAPFFFTLVSHFLSHFFHIFFTLFSHFFYIFFAFFPRILQIFDFLPKLENQLSKSALVGWKPSGQQWWLGRGWA